ncbi:MULTISPECIES: hypothetical protein [Clostridium]|uniref:hypothetical protein n=1 Tax=Clostridium TaxID=1485 RepID=UPI002152E9F7|nr:hypothetical protein [Clostridium sp. LY3-2]MCR6514396.1 hypothetical protein [Clostridium sp. LY3-2]
MHNVLQKLISLLVLFLLSLLTLNHFKIVILASPLYEILLFVTTALIIMSAISVINNCKSGFNKFLNYVILITAIFGGILVIVDSKLNIFVYICIAVSAIYSLMDMIYKKA